MVETQTQSGGPAEPIAIIGMSCRYPGARSLDEFWALLRDGVDAVTEIPADRWDVDAYYDRDPAVPGKMLTRWGGFIDQVDMFDARFFNISPREANHMDPQQRKLLEVAWEALEHAGLPAERIAGTRGGVFIATLGHDYDEYMFDDYSNIDAYIGTGNAHCVAANRLSYIFDLHGPSIALDTACSGSLVAIHMACQSLRSGESTIALAGGVNVILLPKFNIFFSKAGATAPDGRCKTFSAEANGIVRSEGAGIVVLKRLSQAIADGDSIQALILGSAVNSDGRSNGLMAPNPQAQEVLLREAYHAAGVAPADIQYIEAHGTGTSLGDPIEIQALGNIVSEGRAEANYCAIGSVKSNIGHTEAAAGVAGVIKAALAMKYDQIPPSLHVANLNPRIPFDKLPIRVQQTLGPWPDSSKPAIAGVSAFGIGGTNAHVVLRAAPEPPRQQQAEVSEQLLTLSAKNATALQDMARSYECFLGSSEPPPLHTICAAAATRRTHHDNRLALVARSHEDARHQLGAFLSGEPRVRMSSGRRAWDTNNKLAFVFSGQGSHWIGMGRELLEREPVFRATFEACERVIIGMTGWSLQDELTAEPSRLNEATMMQPAVFAIQVALAALWRSWGIIPAAVVGQSLGEIAAAHVAGALSLEDAVRIVVERSRLMQQVAGKGKTAVVELPFEQAQFTLAGNDDLLSIAGSSSPTSSVLSGDPEALERVLKFIERRGIFCRMLPDIDIAFHSPQMDPLKDALIDVLAPIAPRATTMPIYSTVTAELQAGTAFDAAYWGANLREPFLFSAAFGAMLADGYTTFVEVSPHPVLVKPMQDGAQHAKRTITTLPSLRRGEPQRETMLGSLGGLHVQGFPVDWQAIYPAASNCQQLPNYPWQRERFWYAKTTVAPRDIPTGKPRAGGTHPLLGSLLRSALPQGQFFWEMDVSATSPAYLADHQVQGTVVVPGAAYVEMALVAAEQVFGSGHTTIQQLELKQAFFLPEHGARTMQLVVTPDSTVSATFQILSAPSDAKRPTWLLHATGMLRSNQHAPATPSTFPLAEIQQRCIEQIDGTVHYHRMQAYLGLQYGPAFQSVERIWRRDGEVLCALRLPAMLEGEFGHYRIHPSFLDAAFQVVTATLPMHEGTATGDHTFLPVGLERVQVYGKLDQQLWCHVVLRSKVDLKADSHTADIYLLDQEGVVVVEALGLLLHPLGGHNSRSTDIRDSLYSVVWSAVERTMPVSPAGEQWLIFADSGGCGEALQVALEARGGHATCIDREIADPTNRSTFLDAVTRQAYSQIVYMWGLGADATEAATPRTLEADHDVLGMSLVYLIQTLARHSRAQPPRLSIVTRGAQPVVETDIVVPTQASLWGMGRVATHEHPELAVRLIDFGTVSPHSPVEAEALLAELCAANEPEIALRGEERFTARLEHLAPPSTLNTVTWRADGSYLITGGLGGIGLTTARWLVAQGARRLILTSRTPLPPRTAWTQPITDTKQAAAIAAVRDLESMGATIHLAYFDSADEPATAAFLHGYHEEGWPPIRGVIHAAGALNDQLLLNIDQPGFMQVLRTKVLGSWILHRLLADQPIEIFVLCSSMAALFGSIGQANYAAGNAFMDALAHYRRRKGLPALSINWGPWSEVGMAAGEELTARLAAQGITAIAPHTGTAALEHLLAYSAIQATVVTTDWSRWAEGSGIVSKLVAEAHAADPIASKQQAVFVHEVLMNEPQETWQALLETHLQQLVARVLELDAAHIDVQQPLNTLGLDSIMALELKTSIERDLGTNVPLVAILQGPSIREFADRLLPQLHETTAAMEQLLAELESLSPEEVQALLAADQITVEGV